MWLNTTRVIGMITMSHTTARAVSSVSSTIVAGSGALVTCDMVSCGVGSGQERGAGAGRMTQSLR